MGLKLEHWVFGLMKIILFDDRDGEGRNNAES